MNTQDIKNWLEITAKVVTLLGGILAALWAYTKFVVERGLLPPVQFTIECNVLGKQRGKLLLEILFHLKNVGISTLVATDIRARVRYISTNEEVNVFSDKSKATFGRVDFPHSYSKAVLDNAADSPSMISVVSHETFVEPGVDQLYTLITALPESANFVLVLGQFRYGKRPSKFQLAVIKMSRRLGLIHYSLDHVTEPHTVERSFKLNAADDNRLG